MILIFILFIINSLSSREAFQFGSIFHVEFYWLGQLRRDTGGDRIVIGP